MPDDLPEIDLPHGLSIRPVTDDDADALIALIGGVYGEYPGCVLDLDGVDDDLVRPRSHIQGSGGDRWVIVDEGDTVVACVGWAPHRVDERPGAELKRLYVASAHRGKGLGAALVRLVETVARRHGAELMELWSDDRFLDGHRLYARMGYELRPETRDLHDPSNTTELRFTKSL